MTDKFEKNSILGFTLFEILISIFIFSILVTTIFGSYRSVFSSVQPINEGLSSYGMANNCLNRMVLDIKSAYILNEPGYTPPKFNSPPDPYRMVGDSFSTGSQTFPRFRFTSFAHLFPGKNMRAGIAEIVYYVQYMDNDEQYVLKRCDNLAKYPEFEPKAGDPVLCEHIKNITFTYYDHEGTEYDNWSSESKDFKYATPRAIKIKLETGDDSISLFFETMIKFPVYRDEIK